MIWFIVFNSNGILYEYIGKVGDSILYVMDKSKGFFIKFIFDLM